MKAKYSAITTNFSNRLKKLLKERHLKQVDFANSISITTATASRYVNGLQIPNSRILQEIADYFKVKADYLLGFDDNDNNEDFVNTNDDNNNIDSNNTNSTKNLNEDLNRIPVLNSVCSSIPALMSEDNIAGYEYVDERLKKLGEIFALKAKGDSMDPVISDGDIVIVKRTTDVSNGDIALVLINGNEAIIKKINKSSQGITLIPFNPKYELEFYSNDEIINKPILVGGVIIEVRRKLKDVRYN